METELIYYCGSDLAVANAARVSFNKESIFLTDKDERLIRYLAKHGHWTPFAHCTVTLRIKVPIFVARQIHKHQVGFVVNEVSRRYVDAIPEFWEPEEWRERAEDKKQGSGKPMARALWGSMSYLEVLDSCRLAYENLLEDGVCPEQARAILPLATYTEFWMTGSLYAWSRLYSLRIKEDTQKETREVAEKIGGAMKALYPISWEALTND